EVLRPVEQVVDVVQVARLGPKHPRDLHEAAERDGADPVLRVAVLALHHCGREAEIEAKGAHAGHLGHGEVAELVHGDEQEQASDGDEDAHAARAPAPAAAARARRSASSTCSSDTTGSGATCASTSSTTAAMSRKPMRPSRNARTAISLAAFRTQGAVPPAMPASRARARQRKVATSAGSKSRLSGADRSSGATVVGPRCGWVSAHEIGTRMSGSPACASSAPSRKRTIPWTIDCG